MSTTSSRPSKHFFVRDDDGTVRLRLRFDPEEASKFEEAAGMVPVVDWLYETLNKAADEQIEEARAQLGHVPPPLQD